MLAQVVGECIQIRRNLSGERRDSRFRDDFARVEPAQYALDDAEGLLNLRIQILVSNGVLMGRITLSFQPCSHSTGDLRDIVNLVERVVPQVSDAGDHLCQRVLVYAARRQHRCDV